MILKSMGVECKKDDMDGYAGEVDEEATGKFSFLQFCQVAVDEDYVYEDYVDGDDQQCVKSFFSARVGIKQGHAFGTTQHFP